MKLLKHLNLEQKIRLKQMMMRVERKTPIAKLNLRQQS